MQHDLANESYSATVDSDVVRLEDRDAAIRLTIVPRAGNMATSMTVRGQEILYCPFPSTAALLAEPKMCGIPFLGPFANRLDERAFYANGRRYALDPDLGNLRELAPGIPIHGFLTTTPHWLLVETGADASSAWATSRLDFFRRPEWIKQFPFAHTIAMTYRLTDGVLEVTTTIVNLSADPMPVSIGYHPYFMLTDAPRDAWALSVAARTHWRLTSTKVPSGETEPIGALFPDAAHVPLQGSNLDDLFSDLVRDAEGRATMTLRGRTQQLDVVLGANYRAVVIWAPPTAPGGAATFMCIEPMVGITDAMNLAHRGLYGDLQSVAPGAEWQERFWVRPSGF